MKVAVYRVVFTTEVGVKIFDFEFDSTGMNAHYILEEVNRPKFISYIENDLSLLLMNNINLSELTASCDKNQPRKLHQSVTDEEISYFMTEKETGNILRMDKMNGKGKSDITILLEGYRDNIPYQINISHRKIDLKLRYRYIER